MEEAKEEEEEEEEEGGVMYSVYALYMINREREIEGEESRRDREGKKVL